MDGLAVIRQLAGYDDPQPSAPVAPGITDRVLRALANLPEAASRVSERFRGVDPQTGEADYWKRGGLAGLLGMPSWDEQSPTDIAMGFAGSTTPAVKGLAGALATPTKGIRAYHGSPNDFAKPLRPDLSRAGSTTDDGYLGRAFYLSTDRTVPEIPQWPHRYEADVTPKNPLRIEQTDWKTNKRDIVRRALGLPESATVDDLTAAVLGRGHDSVILDYAPAGYPHQEIAALTPDIVNILRKYGGPDVPKGIRAYHRSPYDFDKFDPSLSYRKASFFAATPEQAAKGATAGGGDMYGVRPGWKHTYEVEIQPGAIEGLNLTPAEKNWFKELPESASEAEVMAIQETMPRNFKAWWNVFDEIEMPDGTFKYARKPEPSLSYEEALKTGRDVYGWEFPHYGGNEADIARRVNERGMSGYAISDEAGLSLAITNPEIISILRKYGLLPAAGLGAATGIAEQ